MIETVLFDIDGVLTDAMVYIDHQGNELKRICFDDIDAVFSLKRAGVRIGFITGEDNSFTGYVKKRFEPDYFIVGCRDKLSAFKELVHSEGLDMEKICFVGDSYKDVPLLRYLNCSFAPEDVDPEIRRAAKRVVAAKRGMGVIKEVAKHILY